MKSSLSRPLFGPSLILPLILFVGVAHAEEWSALKNEMIIPVLKVKGDSLDADAACEKLEERMPAQVGCKGSEIISLDGASAHLIHVDLDWREELYVGVKPKDADAVRYFAVGGHMVLTGGTSSYEESSLVLDSLSATSIAGQPTLLVDLRYHRLIGDKISYSEEMEFCYEDLMSEHPDRAPTEAEMDECFEAATAGFIPQEDHKSQRYRLVFVGKKPRLSAAYLAWEEQYFQVEEKRGLTTTKETQLHFEGLSWSIQMLDGKRANGSLNEGPALLFQFKEGQDTW